MTTATDVRARLGKAWIKAGREIERLTYRAQIAQPKLLGPAIRGPLVQLYRADDDFTTEVAFVNYLTFYLLDADIGITVTVTAYDRNGKRLGSGRSTNCWARRSIAMASSPSKPPMTLLPPTPSPSSDRRRRSS